jgi:type I restriction enzyme S subunit
MSTETKKSLVPKLRFPEFRGAEGWECGQLDGALLSISNGLVLEQSSDTSGFKVTRIETISAGTIDLEKVGLVKTSQDISTYKLQVGDILLSNINSIAHIGKSVFVDRDYDLYHGMNLLRLGVNSSKHSSQFIYYLINTDGIRASLRERANKAVNQASINQTELGKTEVALPLKPEQQKIANCLSSLDELISAQALKVEALKTHKKGLMQQLFPREGETQPGLRFPEFQNSGMWETRLLGDVVKSFKTGKLDANAMVENGQYRFYTCAKNHYQIDHYAFEGEALLVAGNGAHLGYIHHYIGKFNAYQRTYVLQQFKANVIFIRCLLDRYLPARILFEKKDGNTPYIVLSTLTDMPLVIPTDMKEQERIADCLTSLDSLITAAIYELETLKTHKKGLMQQLFPAVEGFDV